MLRVTSLTWFGLFLLALVCVDCAEPASGDTDLPGGKNGSSRSDGGANVDAGGSDAAPAADASDGKAQDASPEASSCQGVVCKTAPSNTCDDTTTVRVYEAEGECVAGHCEYPSSTASCPFGCASGACEANPCEGIVCNGPPKNECIDATTLRAHSPNGTCGKEGCKYPPELLPCPRGCVKAEGKCKDDPCIGVTCATPPANKCDGTSFLIEYEAIGACDEAGACAYTQKRRSCEWGCENGVCNGDPCIGRTCATPANYCQDANNLVRYEPVTKCTEGACKPKVIDPPTLCDFGCDQAAGKCKDNPCIGVTCDAPNANYCADGSPKKLVRYEPVGTCNVATGSCQYDFELVDCPGCVGGICKDCDADTPCAEGKYCNDNSCTSCRSDEHCGQSCTDCTVSAQVCDVANGVCVACTADSHCGPGKYCDSGSCSACITSAHCGESCTSCSGTTPVCGGNACECSGDSCGSGSQCIGGACSACGSDAACGPSCTPCGGATPRCLGSGPSSRCVECRSDSDCTTSGEKCDSATNSCKMPAVECSDCGVASGACDSSSSGNRKGCSNAWIIGRKSFVDGAAYALSNVNLASPAEGHFTNTCSNAGSDHVYRVYLMAGETATATLNRTSGGFAPMIRWGSNASSSSCGAGSCTSSGGVSHTHSVTATIAGWHSLVVGAASYNSQKGNYDLTVTLSNCQCGC